MIDSSLEQARNALKQLNPDSPIGIEIFKGTILLKIPIQSPVDRGATRTELRDYFHVETVAHMIDAINTHIQDATKKSPNDAETAVAIIPDPEFPSSSAFNCPRCHAHIDLEFEYTAELYGEEVKAVSPFLASPNELMEAAANPFDISDEFYDMTLTNIKYRTDPVVLFTKTQCTGMRPHQVLYTFYPNGMGLLWLTNEETETYEYPRVFFWK